MRKIIAILALCLPFTAYAQIKPGMPLSEVIRQAQEQVDAERRANPTTPEAHSRKKPSRDKATKQNAEYTLNYNDIYNQYATYETAPEVRTPRARRGRSEVNQSFTEQLNFSRQFGLSLSTNGFLWLAAVPNIDVRLQYDKFSLIGSFAYASWDMPEYEYWWATSFGGELRYDITPNVYIGARYNWFNYNFKLSNRGYQGVSQSLGVVFGYELPIGRKLALDFGLGLGYMLIDNEKYHDEGTTLIRDERRTFGSWGITRAQISLVWRIL